MSEPSSLAIFAWKAFISFVQPPVNAKTKNATSTFFLPRKSCSETGLTPLPSSFWTLPVIPLTGLLFAAIGMTFSLRIPNIDLFSFYFTLFLTPLFLFSDVFFPLKERLSPSWLWVAEALPLLHPVRLARAAFNGQFSSLILWDIAYTLGLSFLLLIWARRSVRQRLTN